MEKKPLTIENLMSSGVSQENAEEVVELMERYTGDPELRKQIEREKGHTLKEEK